MITRSCDWCGRELPQGSGRSWHLTYLKVGGQKIILMRKKCGDLQVDACNDCYHERGEEEISKRAMIKIINLPHNGGFVIG